MKEKIAEALEKASTQHEWDMDGTFIEWKDGHPLRGTHRTIAIVNASTPIVFNNENHENDAHLIANAPEWLRWQNERIEQLEKALEEINKTYMQYVENEIECDTAASRMDTIAEKALGKE